MTEDEAESSIKYKSLCRILRTFRLAHIEAQYDLLTTSEFDVLSIDEPAV